VASRRDDIARSLQLWATCGKQQTADIDERLRKFVADKAPIVAELAQAETELKALELRRLQLTSSLLNAWYSMTEDDSKTDTRTAAVKDELVFWHRLMHVSPETYEFLQPRWERFERLLVSARIHEHDGKKKERSARVARLLCGTDEMSRRNQEDRRGEKHEKKVEKTEGEA